MSAAHHPAASLRSDPSRTTPTQQGGAITRNACRRVALIATAASVLIITTATAAWAEGEPPSLGKVVDNARLWVMGMLAGLATLYFVIGAARYVMAGGDPGQVERAKQTLKSAMAGYALALLAPVVLAVLRGIVGA